jgi:hypothetical protein
LNRIKHVQEIKKTLDGSDMMQKKQSALILTCLLPFSFNTQFL